MLLKLKNRTIKLPKEVVIEIAQKYTPTEFLYIAEYPNIYAVIVYEEDFNELNKIIHGYTINLQLPEKHMFTGFQTHEIDHRHFTLREKAEAVKHYLGIETKNKKEINKPFDRLVWLKKQLEEPIDIPDELLF